MAVFKIKSCLNCKMAHEWIFDSPTLKELRVIKQLTNLSAKAFAQASDEGDPEATAALIYILHRRDGITIPFDDIDLDFEDFTVELSEEEQAQVEAAMKAEVEEKGKESGPTTLNGPIRVGG